MVPLRPAVAAPLVRLPPVVAAHLVALREVALPPPGQPVALALQAAQHLAERRLADLEPSLLLHLASTPPRLRILLVGTVGKPMRSCA